MVFRCAQRRPSDRCRWSSNDLCFSLWKNSDTRSPPLRRGEACMAFFFGLRTIFVSRSDRRRKESKQTPVFVRSLDRRRQKKKKKHRQLWSEIDQTQGRASRAIDRVPAPERPRLRYDLRNRRPGSPWEVSVDYSLFRMVEWCIRLMQ